MLGGSTTFPPDLPAEKLEGRLVGLLGARLLGCVLGRLKFELAYSEGDLEPLVEGDMEPVVEDAVCGMCGALAKAAWVDSESCSRLRLVCPGALGKEWESAGGSGT